MRVIHILKDGSRPKDITGHVVKVSEATTFYDIMKNLNRRLSDESKNCTALRGKTPSAS
jgi:hypothetical protein